MPKKIENNDESHQLENSDSLKKDEQQELNENADSTLTQETIDAAYLLGMEE